MWISSSLDTSVTPDHPRREDVEEPLHDGVVEGRRLLEGHPAPLDQQEKLPVEIERIALVLPSAPKEAYLAPPTGSRGTRLKRRQVPLVSSAPPK